MIGENRCKNRNSKIICAVTTAAQMMAL